VSYPKKDMTRDSVGLERERVFRITYYSQVMRAVSLLRMNKVGGFELPWDVGRTVREREIEESGVNKSSPGLRE
jgi:hypothetical protein